MTTATTPWSPLQYLGVVGGVEAALSHHGRGRCPRRDRGAPGGMWELPLRHSPLPRFVCRASQGSLEQPQLSAGITGEQGREDMEATAVAPNPKLGIHKNKQMEHPKTTLCHHTGGAVRAGLRHLCCGGSTLHCGCAGGRAVLLLLPESAAVRGPPACPPAFPGLPAPLPPCLPLHHLHHHPVSVLKCLTPKGAC